jgi:hypothetical protein
MTRRRPALVLFLFFFSLYALTASGNAFRVPDEFEVYFQAEHLADAGDISVPQTLAITQNGEPIFRTRRTARRSRISSCPFICSAGPSRRPPVFRACRCRPASRGNSSSEA